MSDRASTLSPNVDPRFFLESSSRRMWGVVINSLILLLLLLSVAAPAFAQSSNDVRLVNGIKVNLGPVHDWLKTRKGERPLPHWKQVRIQEMINAGGIYKCLVSIEDEPETSIIMSNIPDSAKKAFAGIAEKQSALESARAQADRDKENLENARQRFLDSFNSVQEAEFNDARARHDRSSSLLEERSHAYHDALQTIASETTVLAMFTGNEYAKMQMWDCGANP